MSKRLKVVGAGCYYHLCSRITGERNHYLFTDVDKENGMKLVKEISELFFLEIISMCWMDNHWHIVLYSPSDNEKPSIQEIAEKYNSYYNDNKHFLNYKFAPKKTELMGEKLMDISYFMQLFQHKFTKYINRVHNRRGTIWAERFKSTILEGTQALWSCVKYVELNPVRAKMIEDPADYRFSTWGNYCGTGNFLFEDHFVKHLRKSLGEIAKDWSNSAIYAEFRGELARTISYETNSIAEHLEVKEKAKEEPSLKLQYLRRTRHWTDGAIIGSKSFIQETALQFNDKKKVMKKKLQEYKDKQGATINSFKKLRI